MMRNLFFLVFMLSTIALSAQSAVRKELYKSARESFSQESYLDAIRDFSEFQRANAAYLQQHPNLKNAIGSAINLCVKKIEERRKDEEKVNSGVMEIEVNAVLAIPEPIYLFPTDSVLSDAVLEEWRNMLSRLDDLPFSNLRINVLTNADSAQRDSYVMSKIPLFEAVVKEQNIWTDRITWEVDPYPTDEGYLSSCMRYNSPPVGSICLDVRLNQNATVFDLE